MPSTYMYLIGTLLLSMNLVRFYGLAISDWFYISALVLAVLETAWIDRSNFACWTRNRFLWPAGLILFGAIISTARTIFIGTAVLEIAQQLFVITLFVSLTWVMVNRGKAEVIVNFFIWSGVFTASVAIIDYFAGTRIGPILSGTPNMQYWGRYAGTLGHPNKLGFFLVLSSILSLATLIGDRPLGRATTVASRLFWGLMVSIQLFGLYLSGSLNAYLGILFGLVALLLSSKTFFQRTTKFAVPFFYIASLLFIVRILLGSSSLSDTSMGLPLVSTALTRVGTTTAQARWTLYEEALEEIINNPLVGVGYDQISTSGLGADYRELHGTVHNLLLQTWYVGGLFTLIGWLIIYGSLGWIAVSVLYRGGKRYTHPLLLCIAAAVLSILFMDQFQDSIYQREKWLVFGLLMGRVWVLRKLKQKV